MVVNPHALSVAPRADLCEEKLRARSASRAASALAAHADHLIPEVDQLIDPRAAHMGYASRAIQLLAARADNTDRFQTLNRGG